MTDELSDAAEVASSDTLEAMAHIMRTLAPEICSVSFHDFEADTLWLSADFILPEDHELTEATLSGRYAVTFPVRDAHGGLNGEVRLDVDSQIVSTRTDQSLETRLAPVLACLAAEFVRSE